MDPNAEDPPASAQVDEVVIDSVTRDNVERQRQPETQTPLEPLLASSIFRRAFEQGASGPEPSSARPPAGVATQQPVQEDPESVRKLQEEDFQRRLRGEYEEAQARVGSVVTSNLDRPLRLTSIRLAPPPPTTRSSFLSSLLSPFLNTNAHPHLPSFLHPTPPPPTNLHEILLSTRTMVGYLDKFGIWDMQRSGVRLEHKRGGDDDEVELVLGLRERGRLFLKAGTEVGGGEGGGNVTGRIRNALGGGESIEANASLGTKTKSAYQLSMTTPLFASPLLHFALSAVSLDRDNTAFASHRERSQGGRAKISAICPWGEHDLTYEYIQRDINHLSPNASVSVRELARPSTKSSLIHTWTSDTRDDPWMGTSGRLLKTTYEYAGLPGSSEHARFLKSTTHTQLSRALYPGSSIHYSLTSLLTFLYPLSSMTELPDRTYVGGPNSVRGFKVGGLGLRDGNDSLGGDLGWGLGLSVFSPFPKKEHWPVRVHSFMNLGRVVGYDRSRGMIENVEKAVRNPSVSVGLGIMYRLDPIRIEVNFSMPLVARRGERLSRGFGIGVGLEFL